MATEYIRVFTRIKPSPVDAALKVLTVNGNCLEVRASSSSGSYAYDGILAEDCTQVDVFNCVGKRIVESCLDGYNGTIFAYGQTGSGKTHTMMGPSGNLSCLYNDLQKGIVPRSAELLVELLDRKKRELDTFKFEINVSFVELYNEIIYDLLGDQKQILLRADDKGVTLIDVTKEMVTTDVDIMRTVEIGLSRRSKAATAMNIESSRSHAIFIIEITMEEESGGVFNRKRCTLNLVDLAGSERQSQSLATGVRLKEAGNINQSLTVLGRVIRTLSQDKDSFVPYRDSKLTHILKDSLGGNSRTAVIVSVHPDSNFYAETVSTLRFAQQCKMVKNKASANREVTGESVDSLKKEIARLNCLMDQELDAHNKIVEDLQNDLKSSETRADDLEETLDRLRKDLYQSECDASDLRSQMRKVCVESFADVTNAEVDLNASQSLLTPKQRRDRRRTRFTLSSQKDTLQRHQERKGISIVWGDEEIETEKISTNKENEDDAIFSLKENNSKLLKENVELTRQCKDFVAEKKALEDMFASTSQKLKASADAENVLAKQLEEKVTSEAKMQKEIDMLNQEVIEYKDRMEALSLKVSALDAELKSEMDTYETDVCLLKSKIEALENELEATVTERDAVKSMMEQKSSDTTTKEQLESLQNECEEHKNSLEKVKSEAASQAKFLDDTIKTMMVESEKQIVTMQKKIERLESNLTVQLNYAKQYREEREQTESFAGRQKEELRRREKDCQILRDENDSLSKKVKEMFHSHTEEIRQLTKNYNENLESLVETEKQCEDAICKKNSMEAKLTAIESELAVERASWAKALEELEELKAKNDLLTVQHNEDVDKLGSVFGHTNNKQKIKEFIKIKAENTELKKRVTAYELQFEKLGGEPAMEVKVTRSRAKANALQGSS